MADGLVDYAGSRDPETEASTTLSSPPSERHLDALDVANDAAVLAPWRYVADVWATPPSRRALGVRARGIVGLDQRINPLPIEAEERSLRWICFGPQQAIDEWRESDPLAPAVLASLEEWLEGRWSSVAGALANHFPLAMLLDAVLQGCLDQRQRSVLWDRIDGVTLEVLATRLGVTRERVRQIEVAAKDATFKRLVALRADDHPIALALLASARRYAERVLIWASAEHGIMALDMRLQCIRQALAPDEARVLTLFLCLLTEAGESEAARLDPFQKLGRSLGDGVTLLPWTDREIHTVRDAFATLTKERTWTPLADLCAQAHVAAPPPFPSELDGSPRAHLVREAIPGLVKAAGLSLHEAVVYQGRLSVKDIRRLVVSDILSRADRPLHYSEIGLRLLEQNISWRLSPRDLIEDHATFATDGNGLWQLRETLGDTVVDRRSGHPALPDPVQADALERDLLRLEQESGHTPGSLLVDLDPVDPAFARLAGSRIGDELRRRRGGERRSVGSIRWSREDLALLQSWLRTGSLGSTSGNSPDEWGHLGLTLIAAAAAAMRNKEAAEMGAWEALLAACGDEMQSQVFGTQRAPRDYILWALVAATHSFDLRHVFDFDADL